MPSCGIDARSSRDARFTICARRANAAIYWKVWRSRWPISMKSSPPSKPRPPRRRRARPWSAVRGTPAPCRRCWSAPGAINTRPDGEIAPLGMGPDGYRLTEIQAQAILEMRLNRLTGLEQEKIVAEYQRAVAADQGSVRHLGAPGAPLAGDPHRIGGSAGFVRRQAAHRDHFQPRRSDHRGSDFDPRMWWSRCRTADMPRRSRSPTTRRSAAAAAARRRPRSRTKISSTSCSSPTRMTPCCASPITARFIG